MSSWLLDTNLLVRSFDASAAQHHDALNAVAFLVSRNDVVLVSNQSIFEFWAVATRPVAKNGLGLSSSEAATRVDEILSDFTNLPDPWNIVTEWRCLVETYKVLSIKAHDIRLAACVRLHRVDHILTFNTDDFKIVSQEVSVINPSDLVASP